MLTYKYTATNPSSGEKVKGELQAQNEQSVVKALTERGLAPLTIKSSEAQSGPLSKIKDRIRTKDKIVFYRQLATLINAGLPLSQSLRTVVEQTKNQKFQVILNQLIIDIESGIALGQGFRKHPEVFDTIVVSLVDAGEVSGTLDEALERIANQTEKDAETAAKIKGAMVYPLIVLSVIVMVVVFMLTTVVPQIEQLYLDLNKDLPFITKIMVGTSDIITNFWWILLLGTLGGGYLLKRYASSPSGKPFFDKFKMNVPLFGPMFMALYMSRFARTSGTLLKTGVSLLDSLRITAKAINNTEIEKSLDRAANKVKGGKALSESIMGDINFLDLVPQMIKIGEQSGSLDAMLDKTADIYEKELDDKVKNISTAIEPILMVLLAGIAGVLVGAILLPVYGLIGQGGGI